MCGKSGEARNELKEERVTYIESERGRSQSHTEIGDSSEALD